MAGNKRRERIATAMLTEIYRRCEAGAALLPMREDPSGFRHAMALDAVAYADALIEALDTSTAGATPFAHEARGQREPKP